MASFSSQCNGEKSKLHVQECKLTLLRRAAACRKAKAIDCMVVDVLKAAEPVLHITRKIWDPRRFLKLDDTILKRIEHYGWDSDSDIDDSHILSAQRILKRLRNRELYKYCGEAIIPATFIQQG